MYTNSGISIQFDELREVDSAGIMGDFTLVGDYLEYPCRMIKFYNETDTGIYLSYDNRLLTQDYIPAGGSGCIYDYGSNKSILGGSLDQKAKSGIWIRYRGGTGPTFGTFFATVIFAM